jgi:hypothetical protein
MTKLKLVVDWSAGGRCCVDVVRGEVRMQDGALRCRWIREETDTKERSIAYVCGLLAWKDWPREQAQIVTESHQ